MNTGIESRKALVDRTNEIARSLDSRFDTLNFIDMPIEDFMKNHENSTHLDFDDNGNEGMDQCIFLTSNLNGNNSN